MKKILFLLMLLTFSYISGAQNITYSKSLLNKAKSGDVAAMIAIAECYYNGLGVTKNQPQALLWYKNAANKGNPYATKMVADCYYYGKGIFKDMSQAVYWMNKAAEGGSGEAMYNLGLFYKNGTEVPVNLFKSVYWFQKAVEYGSVPSIMELSKCYANGEGCKKNKKTSKLFNSAYEMAESGNFDKARDYLIKIDDKMAQSFVSRVEKPKFEINNVVNALGDFVDEPSGSCDLDFDVPSCKTENSNTFAVIIANENYKRESKVDFALNDGVTFGVYCNKILGLPKENIRVIKDATLNDIRGGLHWIEEIANAYNGKARLIFYYSGHGMPDEKSKNAYLLPVDGWGNDVVTALDMNDLYNTLSECPSEMTLVFLDACFSGKQRNDEEMTSARAVGISVKANTPRGKMIVFSAAQGNETAFPYKEKSHGLFTYYLLKKLKETKGNVSLGELGLYIKENVYKKSLITNTKSQMPSVIPAEGMKSTWHDLKIK